MKQILTLIGLLNFIVTLALGQDMKQQPLKDALNPDGTLKVGVEGSFNADGFAMNYGANGEPIFQSLETSSTTPFSWQGFGQSGSPNNVVRAIVISGSDMYVGGSFVDLGGNPSADYIARWDGTSWNALGTGLNSAVLTIRLNGGDLYVGGNFTDAGGNPSADYIARWDGTSWNALGTGLNSTVFAIMVNSNDVYAGGSFVNAGGNLDADRIARWDGTSWNALGTGLGATVYTIVMSGNDIYVGGNFTDAGGNTSADRIARWDGTSWNALGTGLSNVVNVIAISGNNVYVGGTFTDAGGNTSADRIARWDGTSWNALGTGLNGSTNSIYINGSDVYVGGLFTAAGGNPNASRIARWDGTSWNALGTGLNNIVSVIVVSGGDVYVGGFFTDAGGNVNVDYMARWDGTNWNPLGAGLNNAVRAIAVSGSDVYVGGDFIDAGGNPNADRIARWDGASWNALGTGLTGIVYALAVSGSDVYVGGTFTDAGGNPSADRIARWDGANWNSLSTGLNGGVYALAVSGGDVYVGGFFTDAGGNPSADFIARWNGTSWNALGAGLNGDVYALAVSGSDVYVGGNFVDAGGNLDADRIARWDGASWNALGIGLNNQVFAVAVSGNDVYVGGLFLNAGGNPDADRIARWNGTSWNALGTGLNNGVYTFAISGSDVYVGGDFTNAGGNPNANRIARWDGTSWNALGTGVNSSALRIAISGSDAYVGGIFSRAGEVWTSNFAKWIGAYTDAPIAAQQRNVRQGAGLASFNFGSAQTAVRISISAGGNGVFNVFRFAKPPIELGALSSAVKPYRFVVQQLGLGASVTGELRVSLSFLANNGIATPANAIIYQRSNIGSGGFTPLVTTFDNTTNELVAPISAFGEFAVAELAPPETATLTTVTTDGFTLSWEEVFPEYRVVFKSGSSPISPTDGTIILNGAGNSATATGLSSNTAYFAAVYAKKNGASVFSSTAKIQSVATLSTIPEQVFVLAFAAGETGEKVAGGTGIAIRVTTPSTTDGAITVTRNQSPAGNLGLPLSALTASGGSVTADIVSSRWYSVQASGLANYRYAVDFDLTALQGVNNQRTLTLLKRANSSSAWGAAANRHRVSGATPSPNDSAISSPRAGHLLVEGLRDGGEFGFGANSGDNPLPVMIVAFDGNPLAQGIRLNWVTASEVDNAGFVVLRDGVEIASFSNSDALRGRGTTTEMSRYEFIDGTAQKETEYVYKLRSVDLGGFLHEYERTVRMGLFDYRLSQNYPNPFNPVTTIEFTMRNNAKAKLQIFDVLGRVVKSELLDGKVGMNRYVFNGAGLASGVYFYRIEAGGGVGEASFVATKKMLLVK